MLINLYKLFIKFIRPQLIQNTVYSHFRVWAFPKAAYKRYILLFVDELTTCKTNEFAFLYQVLFWLECLYFTGFNYLRLLPSYSVELNNGSVALRCLSWSYTYQGSLRRQTMFRFLPHLFQCHSRQDSLKGLLPRRMMVYLQIGQMVAQCCWQPSH